MGFGIRSVLFVALFSISFSAEARSFRLSKLLRAIGCGQLLSAQTRILDVRATLGDVGVHTQLTVDPSDDDLVHVQAHIFNAKEFSAENIAPDLRDEFNFYVSSKEVFVRAIDSRTSNRAFHVIEKLPERFPYARKVRTGFSFDLKHLPLFIAEIRKLGFEFY